MSNASKRDEGAASELGGKIQEGVGKLIGNERIEAEGKARKLKGQAQKETAKAAERSKGKVEEIAGAVKNRVGAFVGDEELEAEGRVKELKGELRQQSNR